MKNDHVVCSQKNWQSQGMSLMGWKEMVCVQENLIFFLIKFLPFTVCCFLFVRSQHFWIFHFFSASIVLLIFWLLLPSWVERAPIMEVQGLKELLRANCMIPLVLNKDISWNQSQLNFAWICSFLLGTNFQSCRDSLHGWQWKIDIKVVLRRSFISDFLQDRVIEESGDMVGRTYSCIDWFLRITPVEPTDEIS